MSQREEPQTNEYPLGRGYGHDYMRGGEVLGGYGYSDRDEYQLPLSEARRVGNHEQQHEEPADVPGGTDEQADREISMEAGPAEPPTQLEHAFGVGGPRRRSRSYYVTQAQLQQRVYRVHHDDGRRIQPTVVALDRDDDEIRGEVREVLDSDSRLENTDLTIDVADAVVTLRGTVSDRHTLRLACDQAWSVSGVRDVRTAVQVPTDA